MESLASVRLQVHGPAKVPQLSAVRANFGSVDRSAQPVIDPVRKDNGPHASLAAKAMLDIAQRDEARAPDTVARAAAEAAKEAYIRASIAAGLNPLPLP